MTGTVAQFDNFGVQPVTSGGTGGTTTPTRPGVTITPVKLTNALPVFVLPAQYSPLVLTTDPDDGDTLANLAVQRLADLTENGWRPYLANPEVAVLQVCAYMAADLRTLVRAVGSSMYSAFGSQLLGEPQIWASPSQIVTTWTASDTGGHTVPAGTQVSYPGAGTTPLTFTLRGDLLIQAGSSSVSGVVMLCDQAGSQTNQVPSGSSLEIQSSIIWLSTVTATTAANGGSDDESDDDYLTRLVMLSRTLGQQAILPQDFSLLAQQADSEVYRAYTVGNYDDNNKSTFPERTVSVYCLDVNGLPSSTDVVGNVQAFLESKREINFVVVMGTPTYIPIAVVLTVTAATGYGTSGVHDSVVSAVTDFLNPAYWEGGHNSPPTWTGRDILRPHDISSVVNAVPGVDHIDHLGLTGGTAISGTDNFDLAPHSYTRAVLPAGLTTNVSDPWYGVGPTTIMVTVNAAGST